MSQADCAPNTGHYLFASDKSAGNIAAQSPSRRSVLAGLALASVAVAPSAALAIPEPVSEFRAIVDAYRDARRALYAYERDVFFPCEARWKAEIDRIKHRVVKFTDDAGFSHQMTTADVTHVFQAREELRIASARVPFSKAYHKACWEIVQADVAISDERNRISIATGLETVDRRHDEMDDIVYDAMNVVIEFPVVAPDDFVIKMGIVRESQRWEVEWVQKCLSADLDRITMRGAAS